jgi:hypothetical protein
MLTEKRFELLFVVMNGACYRSAQLRKCYGGRQAIEQKPRVSSGLLPGQLGRQRRAMLSAHEHQLRVPPFEGEIFGHTAVAMFDRGC